MDIGDFEKSICELSREPDKTLLLLKAIEQQRFFDGKEAGLQSRDKEIRRIKEPLTTCKLNAKNTISVIGNKYETD